MLCTASPCNLPTTHSTLDEDRLRCFTEVITDRNVLPERDFWVWMCERLCEERCLAMLPPTGFGIGAWLRDLQGDNKGEDAEARRRAPKGPLLAMERRRKVAAQARVVR